MCGIAGIFSLDSSQPILPQAQKMAVALRYRGPDDKDIWLHQDKLAMVHTRLSIQDLSKNGRQPMLSNTRRFVIAYNGEIYNFKKLKKQLLKLNHNFIGNSDTEVMLAAIEEYGLTNAVKLFEGMFAFSLWDSKTNKLYLCRDRLGEKPLFYSWNNNNFLWASELKAFKALDSWSPDINKSSVPTYLKYGYIPSPYSIYENCFKLEAGTILELSLENILSPDKFVPEVNSNKIGKIKPKPFWKFSEFIAPDKRITTFSYDQAVTKLDKLLADVISDQMISDVPYGAFLSGGIDSSLVTSIMQSLSHSPVNTFTIGFKERDFNEAVFAKKISEHLGTDHHELYISSNDCLNLVPKIASIMDEPFADSSILPAYFVSKMAKENVTVCLSGDAGDELFCGYNRYTSTDKIWHKIRNIPLPLRKFTSHLIMLFPPTMYDHIYQLISTILRKKSKNTLVGLKIQKLANLLKFNNINDIYEMLICYCQDSDEISNSSRNHTNIIDNFEVSILQGDDLFIERAMAVDTLTYLPDDNLTKVDRTSMANSLETRLPLLNHRVVEFAWQLPLVMKHSHSKPKRILRDILYKRVPKNLIERPKMGFSVPISDWLKGPLKEWAGSLLLDQNNYSHGLLKSQKIEQIWDQHQTDKKDNSATLWNLLMFQAWYKENFN